MAKGQPGSEKPQTATAGTGKFITVTDHLLEIQGELLSVVNHIIAVVPAAHPLSAQAQRIDTLIKKARGV